MKSVCVVTYEDDHIYELKNIATYEKFQGKGYGKQLVKYIFNYYNHPIFECGTQLIDMIYLRKDF